MVSIVKCHESHYVGVLDNPHNIWLAYRELLRAQRGRTEGAVQPTGRSIPENDPCTTSELSTDKSQMEEAEN